MYFNFLKRGEIYPSLHVSCSICTAPCPRYTVGNFPRACVCRPTCTARFIACWYRRCIPNGYIRILWRYSRRFSRTYTNSRVANAGLSTSTAPEVWHQCVCAGIVHVTGPCHKLVQLNEVILSSTLVISICCSMWNHFGGKISEQWRRRKMSRYVPAVTCWLCHEVQDGPLKPLVKSFANSIST